MNIYPKQPRRFAEKDMEVLSSFFEQAARARVRANLFRELEKEITEIKKADLQMKISLREK